MDPPDSCSLGQWWWDLSGALVTPEICCHLLLAPRQGNQLICCRVRSRRLFLFPFSNVIVPPTELSDHRNCGFFFAICHVLGRMTNRNGVMRSGFSFISHLFLEVLRSQLSICALKRKCNAHSCPSRGAVRQTLWK